MAVTFKQLLNRALRITGEDEIDSGTTQVTDKQQLLVAEMANQIKEEVEAATNWRALRQTVTVALAGSANSGTITEANEKSRVVRLQDNLRRRVIPLVFDITDTSNPHPLKELDIADLLYRRKMATATESDPSFFALDNTSGDALVLEVYPTPDVTKTIELTLIIPQDRLDAGDTTDLAANIKVPTRPIEIGLIRYIYEERGEELGMNSRFSEEKEYKALNDAVALDAEESGAYDLMAV